MSISATIPHRRCTSRLSALQVRGLGQRVQRRELDRAPLAALGDLQERQLGQRAVKRRELGSRISERTWSMNSLGSSGFRSAA